jgi:hypothetical protein
LRSRADRGPGRGVPGDEGGGGRRRRAADLSRAYGPGRRACPPTWRRR